MHMSSSDQMELIYFMKFFAKKALPFLFICNFLKLRQISSMFSCEM